MSIAHREERLCNINCDEAGAEQIYLTNLNHSNIRFMYYKISLRLLPVKHLLNCRRSAQYHTLVFVRKQSLDVTMKKNKKFSEV